MGYEIDRAIEAIRINGYVNSAIDWLYKHPPIQFPEGRKLGTAEEAKQEEVAQGHTLGSTPTEVQPEIPIEIEKPQPQHITEEALQRLNERLQKLREDKQKQEEQDELTKEKARRDEGKKTIENMEEWKKKKDEAEARKIARERKEAEDYSNKLKEKVRLEKLARQQKLKGEAPQPTPLVSQPKQEQPQIPVKPTVAKEYDDCQLQIRLTNGQVLKATFKPSETIGSVVNYIEKNRTDGNNPFTVMTTFPRKVFSPQDMNITLVDAGLVPRGVLVVTNV